MSHHTTAVAVCLALAAAAALTGTARAADPADSPDDLKKLYDDKQYKELIPKLSKALALHGTAADGYDRYQLYLMKGEASLQTKSKSAAVEAFKQAAKATTDKDQVSTAAADALLAAQASGTMTYTPKTGAAKGDKPEPIDILDPDSRKSAFDALEHDMLARAKPKVEAAKRSTNLPQIMEAARGLADIRPVEFAADGGDGDVSALLGDLGNRVCKLLDDDMDHTVSSIEADLKAANAQGGGRPAGGGDPVMTLSRDTHAGNQEVAEVADVAKQMPVVFGSVTDFKPTEQRAADLQRQINMLRKELRRAGVPD